MARQAKGAALIFVAKLVFLFMGYALFFILGRLLSTEEFGVYGVLFAVVSLLNMIVVNGTMQTTSHFVAKNPDSEGGVFHGLYTLQILLLLPMLAAFLLVTPLIAGYLNDEGLSRFLRQAASITLVYGFYSINIGLINGRGQFHQQAYLDMGFAVLKVTLIGLAVYLGYGLAGIIGGFCLTAVVFYLVSFSFVPKTWQSMGPSPHRHSAYLLFGVSILGLVLLQNLFINVDLLVLKHLAPIGVADTWAGYYTASQSVARIPYFLMISYSLVLFPSFASLNGEGMDKRRTELSSRALVATICMLTGMVAVTVPIAGKVLTVLYPERFLPAAPTFSLLLIGMAGLACANVIYSQISGFGKPRTVVIFLFMTCFIQVGLCYLLIPRMGARGAAMATCIAGLFAVVPGFLWSARNFSTRLPFFHLLVVALTTIATILFVSYLSPINPVPGKIGVIVTLGLGFGFHVGTLILFGVISGAGAGLSHKRILLVSKPVEPPFNDGSKVYLKNLVEAMPGDELAICTTSTGINQAWLPPGLETVPVYSSSSSFAPQLLQNLRVLGYLLLNRRRYKAIHFFFAPNKLAVSTIRFLSLISPSTPFLQTVMSRPKSFNRAADLLFGRVILASSQNTVDQLARLASKAPIKLARPGLASQTPQQPQKKAGGRLDLLFAGDLEDGAGLDNLAAIIPGLLAGNPNLIFHFSVRLKNPRIKALAQAFFDQHLAVFDERTLMYMDHSPFEELLQLQDAMIFPAEDLYKKVDAPFVILESFALGKPVFLFDMPPLSEICPAALRPLLVGADPAQLSLLMQNFINNPRLIDQAVLIDHMDQHFSAKTLAKTYEEVYRELE